jgi:hypothetical protein
MATEKQAKFISNLLRQLGYSTQKLHDYAYERIMSGASVESASYDIEKLLSDLELLRSKRRKIKFSEYYTPTGLAEYAFCPVSYSIKASYYIPESIEEEAGLKHHEEFNLEKFLKNLFIKRKREWTSNEERLSDAEKDRIYKGPYGDLLSSKIIYRGHQSDKNTAFYSEKGKLVGKPDFIFIRSNGSKFVLEEKHTWQPVIEKPWFSNMIQVLAYIYGLKHESDEFDKGYLLYFSWHNENRRLKTRNARLFIVEKNHKNYNSLKMIFDKVKELRNKQSISFDVSSLKLAKCIRCSSRLFCRHKTGELKILKYPYYL